jgi:multiple sugar transport system ATP-binding protein
MQMSQIALDRVTKVYGNSVKAVDDISLTVDSGEFMVLVGPSGCGKSTLLRMIAGLEDVTEGTITIGDRDVTELAPRHRDIAMVFQNYALYPHKNVRDNLGYGLKVRKTPKAEVRKRVDEVARVLGLDKLLERRPAELSGGQRQRVAMGRAIVREPAAFLMDEPLSNLDAKLRVGMRAQLAQLHDRLGVTTVYVTHDQVEAMTLGQHVAVMRHGRILQVDAPQTLYRQPRDLFVAAFIGSPAMNLVEARIDGGDITFGQFRVSLDPFRRPAAGVTDVVLGIRPEAFEEATFAPDASATIDVHVEVLEEVGSEGHVYFSVDAPRISAESLEAEEDATMLAENRSLFNARVDPRAPIRVGDTIRLAVDPSRFHFFDRETGSSLMDRASIDVPSAREPALSAE